MLAVFTRKQGYAIQGESPRSAFNLDRVDIITEKYQIRITYAGIMILKQDDFDIILQEEIDLTGEPNGPGRKMV